MALILLVSRLFIKMNRLIKLMTVVATPLMLQSLRAVLEEQNRKSEQRKEQAAHTMMRRRLLGNPYNTIAPRETHARHGYGTTLEPYIH